MRSTAFPKSVIDPVPKSVIAPLASNDITFDDPPYHFQPVLMTFDGTELHM